MKNGQTLTEADIANHYAFENGAFQESDYLTPEQIENVRRMEADTNDTIVLTLLNESNGGK